jgi:hypothetical protein
MFLKFRNQFLCNIYENLLCITRNCHYGFLSYKQPVSSILKNNGIELKQFPVSFTTILGKPSIFTEGGYFRLFPYTLIKHWTNESEYIISYLHPRDFDVEQPVIKELSLPRKFKSYIGLKGIINKLE